MSIIPFAKLPAVAALSAVVALAACTDPSVYDGDTGRSRTGDGAVIGGLVGAGLGALVGDGDAGAAVGGAAVGALVGGAIGYDLDKQAKELRQSIDNSAITVVNTGDRLVVSLPNDLTFATDSSAISPAVRADLRQVAGSLQRYPGSVVQVIGHTDSDGAASYNYALSERRANAVADEIAAGGVSYSRMRIIGRGEDQPVASNLTPEGKARNRRVEIVIIPQ
ncbi:OmpA family protein [Phaeobacter sp. HF9A]|uniref:OmpA family protein n=1 Tax=Phaeobacter sp. HF9A TaxID=2721561 RepID=UPI00142F9A27|nr:OmpA family protein [Phaeobacter sp. HF9A]NIZ15743.1 OmpA family protein [Phaeobacter sp. HF9A]